MVGIQVVVVGIHILVEGVVVSRGLREVVGPEQAVVEGATRAVHRLAVALVEVHLAEEDIHQVVAKQDTRNFVVQKVHLVFDSER